MLIERPVSFASGFRMRCVSCGSSNWLTAEKYAGSPESMMTCSNCENDFNFGPAVIDLTDAKDPALDDSALPQLAWYHTTTDPGWPRHSRQVSAADLHTLRDHGMPEDRVERYRRRHENQAIHAGTYEAAIDSMLRRMRNQGDQESVFYLHRVRLRPDLSIEPGWRDENTGEAAQITSFDLADQGIDGIRYLNAHEAIGSLSLAVVRNAIESTQNVTVPVDGLANLPDDKALEQLCALRDHVQEIVAKHSNDDVTPLAKLRRKRAGRPAPLAPTAAYDRIRRLERFAAERYLVGLSPVAREDFLRSVESPKPEDSYGMDRAWLEKFAGLSALLTRPEEVQSVLASQPWREIPPE